MIKKIALVSTLAICAATPALADTQCSGPWATSTAELAALDSEHRSAEIQRLIDCAKQASVVTQDRLTAMSTLRIDEFINDLIEERTALQKLSDARKQAIGQLQNDLVDIIKERDDAIKQLQVLETQSDDLQNKLSGLTAEREKLNAIIAENFLKIQGLKEAGQKLENDNHDLSEQIKALSSESAAKDKTISELNKSLDAKTIEASNSDSKVKDQEKQINSVNGKIKELESAISAGKALQKETESRLGESLATIAKLNSDVSSLDEKNSELEKESDSLKSTNSDLSSQLNAANSLAASLHSDLDNLKSENDKLKGQVDSLSAVRSEFFAKLKEKLKDQKSVRIVGDRFIIQSEVLFDVGSPDLNGHGVAQIKEVAHLLKDVSVSFPTGIHWVLQVNGHTDIQKIIPGGKFASNWELSTARALTVVKLMQAEGVPPKNLVAAGFGEYQPVDERTSQESFAKNRRIELKLTDDGPYK